MSLPEIKFIDSKDADLDEIEDWLMITPNAIKKVMAEGQTWGFAGTNRYLRIDHIIGGEVLFRGDCGSGRFELPGYRAPIDQFIQQLIASKGVLCHEAAP